MTYYNLSFLDNSTGITQLWVGVNNNSEGWFIGSVLIVLFILMFMVFSDYNFEDVFLANSFIMTIIAGLLFGVQLVGEWMLGLSVAVLAIAIIVKVWK